MWTHRLWKRDVWPARALLGGMLACLHALMPSFVVMPLQAVTARWIARIPGTQGLLRAAAQLYVRHVLMRGVQRQRCRLVSVSQLIRELQLQQIDLLKVKGLRCVQSNECLTRL